MSHLPLQEVCAAFSALGLVAVDGERVVLSGRRHARPISERLMRHGGDGSEASLRRQQVLGCMGSECNAARPSLSQVSGIRGHRGSRDPWRLSSGLPLGRTT